MNFDTGSIFASLLVSGVGFVLFSFGRRQSRVPHMIVGVVLMVFPYFVSSALPMLAIAVGLGALLWAAVRVGL